MTAVLLILIVAFLAWSLGLRALLSLGSLGAIALGLAVALDAGLGAGLPLMLLGAIAWYLGRTRLGEMHPHAH